MKPLRILKWLIVVGAAVVVLVFATVSAAPPPDTPLPLPDVIFYGTTSRDGEPVADGTVKAILPRGDVVSTSIG